MIKYFQIFLFAFIAQFIPENSFAELKYLTGGDEPLSPELQVQFDQRADKIRLGFNTKFISKAGFSPEQVAPVIIQAVDDLDTEQIPGMVIYFDSLIGESMPVALGNFITDPYSKNTDWSTIYSLDELTGPIVTIPILLNLMEQGKIDLHHKIIQDHNLKSILFHKFNWGSIEPEVGEKIPYLPDSFSQNSFDQSALLKIAKTNQVNETSANHSKQFDWLVLGQELASNFDQPIREKFLEEYAKPLGMLNTLSSNYIPSWRNTTAPGPYSDYLGRMAWGESYHPSVIAMGERAAHGGLFSTADDLALYARFLIHSYHQGADDLFTSQTLQMSTYPLHKTGKDTAYGLGWQTGVFGEKSFGWTTSTGRAFWVDPETSVFCIILSNPEHPNGIHKDYQPLLNGYLRRIRQAVILDMGTASIENEKVEKYSTCSLDFRIKES